MVIGMIKILFDGLTYIQMQIEDFLGKIVEVVLDLSSGLEPYLKLFGRPPRFFRRVRRLRSRVLDKAQWRLDNFTGRYLRGLAYLLLRRRMPHGHEGKGVEKPRTKGYLRDIFELNDFTFFDCLQRLLGVHTHSCSFTPKDAFKAEIARIKEAVPLHRQWLEMLEDWDLRRDIGLEEKRVSERQYPRLLWWMGRGLDHFFLQKRLECYGVGLMGSPLKIWDRRFFRVLYVKDPQAGPYKKPRFRGIGYTNSSVLDAWWGLPDYYSVYNARLSDQVVFPNTFRSYMRGYACRKPIALLSDGGCDSYDNNQLVLEYDVIPIIRARGNAVGEVVRTPRGRCFRGEYMPRELWPLLDRVYDRRTAIERRYSLDTNYGLTLMPHKGKEWAQVFIGVGEVLHLLNALTAYKLGELGLIRSSSAFRRVYNAYNPVSMQWRPEKPLQDVRSDNLIYA
jgi:hypothetical protein